MKQAIIIMTTVLLMLACGSSVNNANETAFIPVPPKPATPASSRVKVRNIDCYFYIFGKNLPKEQYEAYEWEGGCKEGMLHGDGVLKMDDTTAKGRFSNGLREGEWRGFRENGTLKWIAPFENGVMQGEMQSYNGDEKLEEVVPFVNGRPHGVAKSYRNGVLVAEIPWANGKMHGLMKYYVDEILHSTIDIVEGKQGCKTYVDDGRKECP